MQYSGHSSLFMVNMFWSHKEDAAAAHVTFVQLELGLKKWRAAGPWYIRFGEM